MPTAVEVYNNCIDTQPPGNEYFCLQTAQNYDPNFKAPAGAGTGGNFWQNPTNVANLVGAAGTAVGQWLPLFGVQTPKNQNQPTPPSAPKSSVPIWVWILVALVALAIIILLIVKLL